MAGEHADGRRQIHYRAGELAEFLAPHAAAAASVIAAVNFSSVESRRLRDRLAVRHVNGGETSRTHKV